MKLSSSLRRLGFAFAASAVCMSAGAWAQEVDVPAAEELLKESKCGKCHSVDKQKDGPSFKKTAAAYKGKADAPAKLLKHITSGPMVKIDGVEEEHPKVKSKDDAANRNLVRYILSR